MVACNIKNLLQYYSVTLDLLVERLEMDGPEDQSGSRGE